jgi:hypothetical protein
MIVKMIMFGAVLACGVFGGITVHAIQVDEWGVAVWSAPTALFAGLTAWACRPRRNGGSR